MKKILKFAFKSVAFLLGILILTIGLYVLIITFTYYRIEDSQLLSVTNPQEAALNTDTEYSIMTYNVGFGAYNPEYSFFMDGGESAIAKSKQVVDTCVEGIISEVDAHAPDFVFLQEIDVDGTRSRHVPMAHNVSNALTDYANVLALNVHTKYLFYPLHEPHGANTGGIMTFAKSGITDAVRISLPITDKWPDKFFDLDRCILVTRTPLADGGELVLINIHLSFYGDVEFRAAQLTLLKDIMTEEYAAGNYVIVGGDWNYNFLPAELDTFTFTQSRPDWAINSDEAIAPEGFSQVLLNNAPTARESGVPYVEGETFVLVLDGFVVSDNVLVNYAKSGNIDNGFLYSDHQPALMTFTLAD